MKHTKIDPIWSTYLHPTGNFKWVLATLVAKRIFGTNVEQAMIGSVLWHRPQFERKVPDGRSLQQVIIRSSRYLSWHNAQELQVALHAHHLRKSIHSTFTSSVSSSPSCCLSVAIRGLDHRHAISKMALLKHLQCTKYSLNLKGIGNWKILMPFL